MGLEGRENFLSNKNQSKKNKPNSSKRKKRKTIPSNQLPLTKRDLSLLEKLNKFGLLSTQQIQKYIFNNIDKTTVLRRLRILKKRGYLFASDGLPRGGLVWSLTKKGALLCNYEGYIKIVNRNTLQHDVLLSKTLFHLEKKNILLDWTPEHVLKRKRFGGITYAWRWTQDSPSLAPDGVFVTHHEGKKKMMALEVEISKKSLKRYEKKISFYQCRKEVSLVWYVVLNKSLGESLLWLWRKKKTGYFSCGFMYSTLEEVMKEDFVLPEVMEEEGRIARREREKEEW